MKPSLSALAVGLLLSGCAERVSEPPPLRAAAPRPPESAPASAVTEAPEPAHHTYVYVASGKRDPFHIDFETLPPPPPPSCDEPLCRYSLDELTLTGVVSGMESPVAVLESPRGKGYSVYRGSKVGKRGGVVKQVLRDAVVVVEPWSDGQGVLRQEEIVLRLRADAPLVLED